jgi:uncharacterized phage-associated protein
MSTMMSAQEIAEWIVRHSWNDLGAPLDPMSLEKHIYYAQSFFLALHDRPLFPDEILAWQKGPVVPEVWQKYSIYGGGPIILDDGSSELPQEIEAHLRQIVSFFGRYTGILLSAATHLEEPWSEARHGIPEGRASGVVISQLAMKTYYRNLTDDGEAALSRQEMLGMVSMPKWSAFYVAGVCVRRMTGHPFYDVGLAQKLSEPVPPRPILSDDFYRAPREKDFVEFNKGDDFEEKIKRAAN